MKINRYPLIFLAFPYLCLIESLGYSLAFGFNRSSNSLESFNSFWNFSAIFWFIPYTLLVIYLVIASKNKTTDEMIKIYTSAPVKIIQITAIVYFVIALIGLFLSLFFHAQFSLDPISAVFGIGLIGFITAFVSFCAGAFTVIISLLLYRALKKINFFVE